MLNYLKKMYKKYLFKIYVKIFFIQNYILLCYNEYYKFESDKSYCNMLRKKE